MKTTENLQQNETLKKGKKGTKVEKNGERRGKKRAGAKKECEISRENVSYLEIKMTKAYIRTDASIKDRKGNRNAVKLTALQKKTEEKLKKKSLTFFLHRLPTTIRTTI